MLTQQFGPSARGRRQAPVLLVEQHPLLRELLEYILRSQLGLTVSACAESGSAAVQAAADLEPQLVLMDFSLPDMDGLQATRAILRILPGAHVVLLIDTPEAAYRTAAQACGVAACIEKTLMWTDLPLAVAGLLDEGPRS